MSLQGRPWDAIEYFNRALQINPDLPEAVSGLVSACNAVCDWTGRGIVGDNEMGVGHDGLFLTAHRDHGTSGWMPKVVELTDKQLRSVYKDNIGLVKSVGDLHFWIQWARAALDLPFDEETRERWERSLNRFYQNVNREGKCVNEMSFVIRFVEWCLRRMQRNWYLRGYGKVYSSPHGVPPLSLEMAKSFPRLPLPPSVVAPPVPSVLPFHTVRLSSFVRNCKS